jgi:hypothetical protein
VRPKPFVVLAWVLVAALLIHTGRRLAADEVVLVPGTINGVATIGTLPISLISITASPSSGGNSQSINVSPFPQAPNAPYSMTVSVPQAGSAAYNLTATIRTDANRDIVRFATTPVSVSASAPAQQDFVVLEPGFIEPVFTVTGSATISQVSMSATFSAPGTFESASTSAPATTNFVFPAIPRSGMTLSGTVTFSNGVQRQLPVQTISVLANETTLVPYTVDGDATGSIAGSVTFSGAQPVNSLFVSVSGPTFRSISQTPPAPGGFSLGPLAPGSYFVSATARLNNFDDSFSFPTAAYAPGRFGNTVGSGETIVDVAADQAYIDGTLQLTGASSMEPFISGGSIFATGAATATSGGSSSDNLTVATRAFDLVVSPGAWRLQQARVSYFRPAPFLSGNFTFSDNRPAALVTVAAGETLATDIAIPLGEVTLTMSVAGGATLSNPSVTGSCVQRDDANVVLWSSSFFFSTSGQNNVTQGEVTFVAPGGNCTVTARAIVNGQTVNLPAFTQQVVAGSSQTVDAGGPTLTITSPAPETIVSSSSLLVFGKASDDVAVASVTVNGVNTNRSSAGNPSDPAEINFSTVSAIVLQRGPNTITTVAKDTATPQNTTTDTRTVYWDTALPTLGFTPATGFTTFATSTPVTGTATDDAGVKRITINGTDATFASTNNPLQPNEVSFSGSVPLSVGTNSITVVVTDVSNRTRTDTHTVTRQQQAPTALAVTAASAVYGGTVDLVATLTSDGSPLAGKTVRFTVNGSQTDAVTNASGIATAGGVSVGGMNVGSYPGSIAAAFDGDADYLSSGAAGDLTITKAAASISLGNLTQTYDGSGKSASASTTPAGLSGLAVTYNGSAALPVNVGSYTVAASLANDNYEADSVTGTLTIVKAAATISVGGLAHTYDGTAKTASVSTTPAGLTGVSVTYDGGAAAPVGAGSYAVRATLLHQSYEAPPVDEVLVIAKAGQAITFDPLSDRTFGDDPFTVAAQSSSGLSVSFTAAGACSVAGNLVTITGGGACTVTAAQPGDANHEAAASVSRTFNSFHGWSGVLQPVRPDGSSVFKLGSTVPVKFQLTGASASITDLTARIYLAKVSNGVIGTEVDALPTNDADTGNTFRYDEQAAQYIFNLGTKSLSQGTWQIRIDLGDGATHVVLLSLRK